METRNYETVFITNHNATESRLGEIAARNKQIIESFSGKILQVDDWGKKKLAYPIRKEQKGHYFCLTYNAGTECVAELERNMRINEDVYRFLTVKIDEKVDPMAAIAAFKNRLEAHAKREKERAERDAERGGGDRGGRFERPRFRDDREDRGERSAPAPVEEAIDIEPTEGEE